MKAFIKLMLASAVLLVMTSFTNSTANTPVKDVFGCYYNPTVEIQQDYNYQPISQQISPVLLNEEFSFVFTVNGYVPGGVLSQPCYWCLTNNVELVYKNNSRHSKYYSCSQVEYKNNNSLLARI
jgi:hypothetical protein